MDQLPGGKPLGKGQMSRLLNAKHVADLAAADKGLTTRRASLAIDLYLASEQSP